jgi:hypothetical protein
MAESRAELDADTAIPRMHMLLSFISIVKATEPQFSIISDDTLPDTVSFFEVTSVLLHRIGREIAELSPSAAESKTRRDSFLKLLQLLESCVQSDRFVNKLRVEDTPR